MSDGGPFHWIGPNNATLGPSVVPWLPGANGAPTYDYWYPMNQSARLLWYHDHAVGITRLNAYAGIASACLITDDYEQGLIGSGIPSRLVPLVLQEKSFIPLTGNNQAGGRGNPGDLWYASVYEKDNEPTGRWDWAGLGYKARQQAANPVVHPGVLRRHHRHQRLAVPVPGGRAGPVPFPHAERLPGQVL